MSSYNKTNNQVTSIHSEEYMHPHMTALKETIKDLTGSIPDKNKVKNMIKKDENHDSNTESLRNSLDTAFNKIHGKDHSLETGNGPISRHLHNSHSDDKVGSNESNGLNNRNMNAYPESAVSSNILNANHDSIDPADHRAPTKHIPSTVPAVHPHENNSKSDIYPQEHRGPMERTLSDRSDSSTLSRRLQRDLHQHLDGVSRSDHETSIAQDSHTTFNSDRPMSEQRHQNNGLDRELVGATVGAHGLRNNDTAPTFNNFQGHKETNVPSNNNLSNTNTTPGLNSIDNLGQHDKHYGRDLASTATAGTNTGEGTNMPRNHHGTITSTFNNIQGRNEGGGVLGNDSNLSDFNTTSGLNSTNNLGHYNGYHGRDLTGAIMDEGVHGLRNHHDNAIPLSFNEFQSHNESNVPSNSNFSNTNTTSDLNPTDNMGQNIKPYGRDLANTAITGEGAKAPKNHHNNVIPTFDNFQGLNEGRGVLGNNSNFNTTSDHNPTVNLRYHDKHHDHNLTSAVPTSLATDEGVRGLNHNDNTATPNFNNFQNRNEGGVLGHNNNLSNANTSLSHNPTSHLVHHEKQGERRIDSSVESTPAFESYSHDNEGTGTTPEIRPILDEGDQTLRDYRRDNTPLNTENFPQRSGFSTDNSSISNPIASHEGHQDSKSKLLSNTTGQNDNPSFGNTQKIPGSFPGSSIGL